MDWGRRGLAVSTSVCRPGGLWFESCSYETIHPFACNLQCKLIYRCFVFFVVLFITCFRLDTCCTSYPYYFGKHNFNVLIEVVRHPHFEVPYPQLKRGQQSLGALVAVVRLFRYIHTCYSSVKYKSSSLNCSIKIFKSALIIVLLGD